MRRKINILIIIFLICNNLMSQTNLQTDLEAVNFGDMPKPLPTISSLSTYTENPPTTASSIPDISLTLINFQEIAIHLSYNPLNVSVEEAASEVGLGWTLYKGGVISREINGIVDETFQSTDNPYYEKNQFDDIYYYDLPEYSGKFKFQRDIVNNTFQLINLTPEDNIKIEYTTSSNNVTLLIESFVITDEKGYKYSFSDYSKSAVYSSYYSERNLSGLQYKSGFYLSKVTDPNGVEITNYSYQKESKFYDGKFLYETAKLNNIVMPGKGSVYFTYLYHSDLEKTMNDPYSLETITIRDHFGSLINQYRFNYSSVSFKVGNDQYSSKRSLNYLSKWDSSKELERTNFIYYPNSETLTSNILQKIIYPSKACVEYVYENGETYTNKDQNYLNNIMAGWEVRDNLLQYEKNTNLTGYDTEQSLNYDFIVPGDPSQKKYFTLTLYAKYKRTPGPINPDTGYPTIPPPLTDAKKLRFTIKRGNEIIASNIMEGSLKLFQYPGNYSVEITVGYVYLPDEYIFNATGYIIGTELALNPPPYRNSTINNKFRIKAIKSFKYFADSQPSKSVTYSYDDFMLPNSSSGYWFDDRILYKNVQVSENIENGYTRLYYKLPSDYPSYPYTYEGKQVSFWPYYNIMRSGLLEKKEIYNQANQLISSEKYNYVIENVNSIDYHLFSENYSKVAWIKSFSVNSDFYPTPGQTSISSSVDVQNNNNNFKTTYKREIGFDGNLKETFYRYPLDKNNQKLLSANMNGVLVETETKLNNKTVSKVETKYDNANNLFPSSIVSTNPNDLSLKTDMRYDLYDERGNLVQYTTNLDATTGQGNYVTIIWGYNKTLPIAKVIGAKKADIGTLADDIISKSNLDSSPTKETELMNALDTFRNQPPLKDFLITTHTYDLLIGVTSTTNPNGQREIYRYDTLGRLTSVVDADGNIIKETKYNNKQ